MNDVAREDALATLRDGDARIQELVRGLTPEQMTTPATIGGGEWSAKDLVGHLAFWEELALEALAAWRAGKPFDTVTDADELNAQNQVRKRDRSLEQILREGRETHERLMAEIGARTDEEWSSPMPSDLPLPEILGKRLGGLTGASDGPFRHAFAHLGDLRAYVESLG